MSSSFPLRSLRFEEGVACGEVDKGNGVASQ